jgi:transcriptional regulator with XRE-family HTH domain
MVIWFFRDTTLTPFTLSASGKGGASAPVAYRRRREPRDTISSIDTSSGIEDFGALLARLRGHRVSQRALAIRAGTSQSYVSRVEAGAVQPTLGQAERLLNCLGYQLTLDLEPLPSRSDPHGLPAQLAMTAEERVQSAAAIHNAVVGLRSEP